MLGGQIRIVQIVEQLRQLRIKARESHRTGAGRQAEAGMKLIGGGLLGLAIREDDLEFAGVDHQAGGEGPLSEVRIIVRQVKPIEAEEVRAGIIELDPGIHFARAVGQSARMVRLHFVQPKGWIRWQGGDG